MKSSGRWRRSCLSLSFDRNLQYARAPRGVTSIRTRHEKFRGVFLRVSPVRG